MIEKLLFWCGEHRKKIGYTLGALNAVSGIHSILNGQTTNGILILFVGTVLIFDAWLLP
jgi:hypothetical protein